MRILALSPGSMQRQLIKLPALSVVTSQLGGSLQIACATSNKGAWRLLPAVEKVIPFTFNSNPSLAYWSNLLCTIRKQDFQTCLNFAKGIAIGLMFSISHIPTRVAEKGFSRTENVAPKKGWPPQKFESYLKPLGLSLNADSLKLSIPKAKLEEAKHFYPPGHGPILMISRQRSSNDLTNKHWESFVKKAKAKKAYLRRVFLNTSKSNPEP